MVRYFFSIFLLLFSGNLYCRNNSIRFQHITSKDGLSQGHILCMMQDSEGYIWIGTYDGLNRYNGYTFNNFFADDQDTNSLTINVVYSLFEDRDGNIWCGTWGIDIGNPASQLITCSKTCSSGLEARTAPSSSIR
ncbi:MAG TPA: two-component regulator propeller domain-containing protein [Bacteroidales bacterium]|nr:two-component regulator propeller domain-containing protein [Bacteroidales bacterium]